MSGQTDRQTHKAPYIQAILPADPQPSTLLPLSLPTPTPQSTFILSPSLNFLIFYQRPPTFFVYKPSPALSDELLTWPQTTNQVTPTDLLRCCCSLSKILGYLASLPFAKWCFMPAERHCPRSGLFSILYVKRYSVKLVLLLHGADNDAVKYCICQVVNLQFVQPYFYFWTEYINEIYVYYR